MEFEHYEGMPRKKMTIDKRSIQEVLQLHLQSAKATLEMFRRIEQPHNVATFEGVVAGLEEAIAVADFRDKQTTVAPRTFTATIFHTLLDGRSYRQCLRCSLKIDSNGDPDAYWYSPKQIARFKTIDIKDRCDHNRGVVMSADEIPGSGRTSARTSLLKHLLSWNVRKLEALEMLRKFDQLYPEQAVQFEPVEKLYDFLWAK